MQATPKRNKSMGCLPSISECCFTIPSYHMQPTCIPLRPRHLNFQRSWVTQKSWSHISHLHILICSNNLASPVSSTKIICQDTSFCHGSFTASTSEGPGSKTCRILVGKPKWPWHHLFITQVMGLPKKHKLFSAKSLFRILRVLIVVEHLDPSKPPPGIKLISKT